MTTPNQTPTQPEAIYNVNLPASHIALIMDLLTSAPIAMRQSYPIYSALTAQVAQQDAARNEAGDDTQHGPSTG